MKDQFRRIFSYLIYPFRKITQESHVKWFFSEKFVSLLYYNLSSSTEHERLLKDLKPRDNLILDIGTGVGPIYKTTHAKINRIVGIDFSLSMLKTCKMYNRGSDLICADAKYLPFRDSSFDLSVAYNILKYCKNRTMILNEIERTTKGKSICKDIDFPKLK